MRTEKQDVVEESAVSVQQTFFKKKSSAALVCDAPGEMRSDSDALSKLTRSQPLAARQHLQPPPTLCVCLLRILN